jgi:hypothetical protein
MYLRIALELEHTLGITDTELLVFENKESYILNS